MRSSGQSQTRDTDGLSGDLLPPKYGLSVDLLPPKYGLSGDLLPPKYGLSGDLLPQSIEDCYL